MFIRVNNHNKVKSKNQPKLTIALGLTFKLYNPKHYSAQITYTAIHSRAGFIMIYHSSYGSVHTNRYKHTF